MKKCERKRAAVVLCGISAAIFLSQMWGSETSQAVERKALPQNAVMDQQRLGYYDQKVEASMDLEKFRSTGKNTSAFMSVFRYRFRGLRQMNMRCMWYMKMNCVIQSSKL